MNENKNNPDVWDIFPFLERWYEETKNIKKIEDIDYW